jgi:hemoglobin-like flavoprotein
MNASQRFLAFDIGAIFNLVIVLPVQCRRRRPEGDAPLTPSQKLLVRTSFAKVEPIADIAAVMFYEELFERDPRLRHLFKNDMLEQRRKLMQMLAVAVEHLDDWETIATAVRALGKRHRGYGVSPADYDTVGAALIAALERGLGPDFTPDVREAWLACIAAIASEMLDETAA